MTSSFIVSLNGGGDVISHVCSSDDDRLSSRERFAPSGGVDSDETRLAVPRRGHVLSTVVQNFSEPIRGAVAALTESLAKGDSINLSANLFAPADYGTHVRSAAEGVAWNIVSRWVVGVAVGALPPTALLSEAENWFYGGNTRDTPTAILSPNAIVEAETLLRGRVDKTAYLELLPYILDPHGPGSRLSVKRDPTTRVARKQKRATGVFYTPTDVAEYMASNCLRKEPRETLTVFDPACGTGVFLRAALKEIRSLDWAKDAITIILECLYGADIDPWALDASAFVLLSDCFISGMRSAPIEVWRQIRRNLVCFDTLRIDPATSSVPVVGDGEMNTERLSISQLFPRLSRGPTVFIGNPPYADLGQRPDMPELARAFETLAVKPDPNAEIYLVFIEQMIRLCRAGSSSGALVLPLSVACNIGKQYSKVRELISGTRGCWRFAFFDREPHALFGEDVKTRNAIVLWSRAAEDRVATLYTGPLRKWRSDSRAAMFKSITFTAIQNDIRSGIPKIEGSAQAAAFAAFQGRWGRLKQVVHSITRVGLTDIEEADNQTVFVGPTAYNFLNVFLKPHPNPMPFGHAPSEHELHAIQCASRKDALAVFGILSSHLVFWLWHSSGDGFHVSGRFLAELPFGTEPLTPEVIQTLAEIGDELWSVIVERPVISLNRGKTSLAYTPNGHDDIRRKIDETLAEIAGLDDTFVNNIQQFTARTVAATLPECNSTEPEEDQEI
ncbi:MAG TPA: N-6 DNA methylase [Bryobacteraceae bacterium]|jgi:hypothetical protein